MTLSTLSELQAQFDALSARIAALDKDIALETDSERRAVARERRTELAHEREIVAGQMEMMQRGQAPADHAPVEHRITALERDVRRLWGLVRPGPRQLLAKVIFYGLIFGMWSLWMIKEIRDWLMLHPLQAVLITMAVLIAALIIRWLPEDDRE